MALQMSAKNNWARNAWKSTIVVYVVFAAFLSIAIGIKAIVDSATNSSELDDYEQVVTQNLFFTSVGTGENLLDPATGAHQLYEDLMLFSEIDSNGAENPFAPTDISEITIPARYGKIDRSMAATMCVAVQDGVCADSGQIGQAFSAAFAASLAGDYRQFILAENYPDLSMHLSVGDFPIWYMYAVLWIFFQIVMGIVWVAYDTGSYSSNYRYKHFSLKYPSFWFSAVLMPIPAFFIAIWLTGRNLSGGYEARQKSRAQRAEAARLKAEKEERLKNNPLRVHLLSAEKQLADLKTFTDLYPQNLEIKQSYDLMQKVYEELITFPDLLSEQAASFVAREARNNANNSRDAMTIHIETRDSLNG